MIRRLLINILLIASTGLLSACTGFFDKDNTPEPKALVDFKPSIKPAQLWSVRTGDGSGKEYLRMSPAISESQLFVVNANGLVTAVNKANGHISWQKNTKLAVQAGAGAGNGIVVITSRQGHVLALSETDGQERWKINVGAEILAKPSISNGRVIIKTTDGQVYVLSSQNGSEDWSYQESEPSFLLRAASSPVVYDKQLLVGFANGKLAKFNLADSHLLWIRPIAFAEGAFVTERMIDIDADPIVYHHSVYAATYRGKIASLDWTTGNTIWSQDISSYSGMTADDQAVYISDAKGHMWRFNANDGQVQWQQKDLEARVLSAPANMGQYVAVGDGQGYVHWLNKQNGQFAGRVFAGAPIYASPIAQNNVLYALTNNGYLIAYILS